MTPWTNQAAHLEPEVSQERIERRRLQSSVESCSQQCAFMPERAEIGDVATKKRFESALKVLFSRDLCLSTSPRSVG